MASLIEGYEYDIFISYRQKDNKYDGWVTEFVDNLKKELEATFKEEISVYFDINPHDGLLETHDVDESLKDKLNCLIFIPIISRTYCDPKSFAWEHEFKAFVELASRDEFGLKVKLPNGNVTNRVLPIQINGLKTYDKTLVEKELGGFLRSIEFIYTEPGVNRPLTAKDSEEKNQNRTNYRNQINKVANSIDEILSALKAEPGSAAKEKVHYEESVEEVSGDKKRADQKQPVKGKKTRFLIPTAVVVLLIIAGIITYPKIFKRDTPERLRTSGEKISIVILPFQNRTNNASSNDYEGIVQDILINSLSYNEKIKIKQYESISDLLQGMNLTNNASISTSFANKISKKLDANIFITGSINQISDRIYLGSQLIDSRTRVVIKPFNINASAKEYNIIEIADSLSVEINNFLSISYLQYTAAPEEKKFVSTQSPEAYSLFISGTDAFYERDYQTAVEMLLKSIAIDSNFYYPYGLISYAYHNQGFDDQAKMWALKAYEKRDELPRMQKLMANEGYATFFGNPNEAIIFLRQIEEIDDELPRINFLIGNRYRDLGQFDKAIPEYTRALEIYKAWKVKPQWSLNYTQLGRAYHETGQYNKEIKLYKKAERDFPDDPSLIRRQAILSLAEGKKKEANEYIDKYVSLKKESAWPESRIVNDLGNIYSDANIIDKAEEYYRQAALVEPDNKDYLNTLAYFLIDKDRNVNEGLELVGSVLKSNPDDFSYLHTKGWGLYKLGKYQVALNILQKSWDLRRDKGMYNHAAYLHLEEVKQALNR